MLDLFDDRNAAARRETQCVEMFGNRGIYHKGWSQVTDLAKQMPDKLHELQRLWLIEATRRNVVPIDDQTTEKFNPDTAGRPHRRDRGPGRGARG
jgi:arylsulfatase